MNNSIFNSDGIENSSYVVGSQNVVNSCHVFNSEEITNGYEIGSSTYVENGKHIYSSDYIYDSEKIINSKNVNKCSNIVQSNMVLNSTDVYNCMDCNDSTQVRHSELISDCHFCANCGNLKHALFCSGQKQGEYLIFNKPVSKEKFELALKQYNKFITPLVFIKEWPEESLVTQTVQVDHNFQNHYTLCTDKFWKWVQSLPEYDPMILYAITMLPKIIAD